MNENCGICHGVLKQTMTTYSQVYNERFVVVENVPAWVCGQCGEMYYDPDVVERLQNVIWSGAAPVRTMETPVYDLSKAG